MDFLSTAAPTIVIILAVILLPVIFWPLKNKRYPPVAGTIVHLFKYRFKLHDYFTELACNYKTYRISVLFKYIVFTADPANVEYLLKTNFANYGKGEYVHSLISDVVGDGIFSVDGEKWRHQRKTSSSHFSTKILREFSSEIFKTNAVKLAGIIHEAATRDESIEMQDLFMKSTLDSIVKILLGFDLGTMSKTNNEESIRFSNAFDAGNAASLFRVGDIVWKIKRFLNIGTEAMLREHMKVVDQFIYKLINKKIERLHNPEDDDELPLKKKDFVSRLLETCETDPKYLRDIVLTFIAAGKDTTASALSWFFYMMCKHLDIQEKIAQEVREATGLNNSSSVDEVAANLTEEALNKMQYLHAALNETLRLYPTVPMNARICFSDDVWPDGYSIKKGQLVIFQPYSMGRMKFIWGDDAEEFRPERWLDENGNFQEESPFKFLAFNAGPRICMGKDYSFILMKIFAAALLNNYTFKLSDEKKVVKYKMMVTLHINKGLNVHASPRV
ncbi:putative abieta-7,13-dien-18-ol hydroxylase [Rosa chinensis]|uniref:Putative abieta-7,13-dien-18-ol hydroxylase n=1 Tax=Rosa chinensis TaxID=74649 RepID=A0A2P6SML8_ROSCH|nr:cytochrome P450 704C1 [Rosa chinensis]PRQ59927.1 putative abieta-7,13-dien-18-ol hydroxylase [Rosa chinensis]